MDSRKNTDKKISYTELMNIKKELLAKEMVRISAADITERVKIENKSLKKSKTRMKKIVPRKRTFSTSSESSVEPKVKAAFEEYRKSLPKKKDLPVIYKEDLLKAREIMESKEFLTKTATHSQCFLNFENSYLHWSSPQYLMINIRACMLNRDWAKMAYLLNELAQKNRDKKLNKYLWNACYINLLNNPADEYGQLLEEFKQQCLPTEVKKDTLESDDYKLEEYNDDIKIDED